MNNPRNAGSPILDSRFAPFMWGAVLALATFVVYLPVFNAGYIWDDDTGLTENPLIRSLSGLRDIWFSTKPYDYFPLTFTSFWLEWRLWGSNATGYHAVNVLLHAVGAILFWRVLVRLKIPGAWVAALVFAVHPVCVASVAWVSERKNTLSLVFYLLSILWYLRFDSESHSTPRKSGRWYWLSLFAFLLALLSKTSVVTLPFVVWLCVWWRQREGPFENRGPARSPANPAAGKAWPPVLNPRLLLRLAPFFALALVLGLVTVWFQTHRAMSGNYYQRDELATRLLGGTWAVWFYLGKVLLPLKLSMIYPRWNVDLTWIWGYVPALAWWGGVAVCWRFRRAWGGALLFGLGCFFVTLLPVLGFFDMSFYVYSRVADHLQYLALPSVIALVVGVISSRLDAKISIIVLVPLVVLLGLLTWKRAHVFRGQESLWRDTLAKNPRAWAAYNNLGMATKDPVEEFNCYVTALSLNPDYADAHNNLGVILYQRGKAEEAIGHFKATLRLQPGSAPAHNNLGGVLMNQGKPGEALALLRQAVQINPNYVEARNNLGLALLRLGQPDEAATHFETSLRLLPGQPDTQYNLGNIRFNQRRFTEAAIQFQAALRARPASFELHHNLGAALGAMGQFNEALTEYAAALKLKPDFSPSQYQTGEIMLKQGRTAEALQWFAAAARSQPDSAETRYRLGATLAEAKQTGDAIFHLREAVRLKPDWVEALCNLAWMQSTQADAKYRDGKEASRLAGQANQLTGGTNMNVLDTLAAAQAESGQFAEATRTAQHALELARAAGDTNLSARIETRLRLYASGQPFRSN